MSSLLPPYSLENVKVEEGTKYIANLSSAFSNETIGGAAYYQLSNSLASSDVYLAEGTSISIALPNWLNFNRLTGVLHGTPTESSANQILKFDVTATNEADPEITETKSFYIYVTPKNDPSTVINQHQSERVISTLSEQVAYGRLLITDDRITSLIPEPHLAMTSINTENFENGDEISTGTNPFGDSFKHVHTPATDSYFLRKEYGDGTWTEQTQENWVDWQNLRESFTDSFGTDLVMQWSTYITEAEDLYLTQITGQVFIYNQLATVDVIKQRTYTAVSAETVAEAEGTLAFNGSIYSAVDGDQYLPNFISTTDLNKQTLIHQKSMVSIENTAGIYGTLNLDPDSVGSSSVQWIYTIDTSDSDTKLITPGEVVIDAFVISYTDGNTDNTSVISVEVMGGIIKPDFSSIIQTVGNASNNEVTGDNDVDVILGKAGDDTLKGLGGGDQIDGGEGNDLLDGGDGSDFITTGLGADRVISSLMDDHIYLTPDDIWSKGYVAVNVGGTNSFGTGEVISIAGYNKFSDVINGGENSRFDTLELSSGDDAFFLHDQYSDFHDSLSGNTARLDTVDIILGGMGNDIIDLSSLDFDTSQTDLTVFGGGGDDVIWSGDGGDRIYGGEGRDFIFGSGGDDVLIGGTGADVFKFTSTCGANTIEDFSATDGDQIELFFKPDTLYLSPIDHGNDYSLKDKTWDSKIDLEWNESSKTITWSPGDVSTQVYINLPNFEFEDYNFQHLITLTELI